MSFDTVNFEHFFAIGLRNGLTRPKAVRGQGIKMVNMGEVFANSRIGDIAMERVLVSDKEAELCLLQAGDLLFARQSLVLEGAGKCCIFLGSDEPVTFESHIIRARLNPKLADPHFFFHFFQSQLGRQTIESIVEQVAAAGIRGSDLAKLQVPNVSLSTQKTMARFLQAIDQKIEVNRQMTETLEEMARVIFREWTLKGDKSAVVISERTSSKVL